MAWGYYGDEVGIDTLVGKTIRTIADNVDEINIVTTDGEAYRMCHHQDCCESVSVEDICGDLEDLVGSPIVRAEERTSEDNPDGGENPRWDDAQLWTFYELATNKGSVTIRWFGTSNGYYSVSVRFERVGNVNNE